MALRFNRLDATVAIRMRQSTIETRDGSVESLDVRTLASGQELHVFGAAKNGQMLLTIEGTSQPQQTTLAWGPEVRGPYAVEQSLAQTPIKPGEKRALKMFNSDVNKVSDITLTAKGSEDVPLIGRAKKALLRVEQTTTLDGKPRPEFDMTLWVDPEGEVQKTSSDNLGGMVTYRTSRNYALAPAPAGQAGVAPFDQIASSIIKVSPPIARPSASRAATYRVTLKDDDPAQVIPADRRQSLKPGGAKNAGLLEVQTAGPDAGKAGPAEVEPEYLRPNAMIDSADERVVELSRKAVGDATGPWEKVGPDRGVGGQEPQEQELQGRVRPRQRGRPQPRRRLHRARRPDRRHVPRCRGAGPRRRRLGLRR